MNGHAEPFSPEELAELRKTVGRFASIDDANECIARLLASFDVMGVLVEGVAEFQAEGFAIVRHDMKTKWDQSIWWLYRGHHSIETAVDHVPRTLVEAVEEAVRLKALEAKP